MQRKVSANFGNLLLSLSEAMDLTSSKSSQHQQRTAFIAWEIAKAAELPAALLEKIFMAALLHDIGVVSVEEKVLLHKFKEYNLDVHCIRGEVLLNKVPWLSDISVIVRNHHREWSKWDKPIEDPDVLAAQIVFLADYIERLIDRELYILHQYQDIIENIKSLTGDVINPKVAAYFLEVAGREEFWLDLSSQRLYSLLLNSGPFKNVEIGIDGISAVAELFRDIIDFKSRFTSTHTSGVASCAEILSRLFGLTEIDVQLMKVAGNFHDIGKLLVPNSILEKPYKLTKEEFAVIKCHTYYTYYILNTIGGLQQIAEWASYHHEKLNGTGYPFKCKAEEINTGARIMAVADIFTAISEDRPYRKGMMKEEIFVILNDMVSTQSIDKHIVDLLFENYDLIDAYVKAAQKQAREFYESQFAIVNEKFATR